MKNLLSYLTAITTMLIIVGSTQARDLSPAEIAKLTAIRCNNLVYAEGKTSVCFADKFLTTAKTATGINVLPKFNTVKLGSKDLFESPFTVISGEGDFRLNKAERKNLRKYLNCGGFLLASPGCSDKAWNKSFRAEIKALFPESPLKTIPMTHPIFSLLYEVPKLNLKGGGKTLVEGIEINGRLALIYSAEGLNDVNNAKGCCCCGGNMILESEKVNVNILLHALTD